MVTLEDVLNYLYIYLKYDEVQMYNYLVSTCDDFDELRFQYGLYNKIEIYCSSMREMCNNPYYKQMLDEFRNQLNRDHIIELQMQGIRKCREKYNLEKLIKT